MRADRIAPHENLRLQYDAPRRGLVRFVVDAEEPVTTYVVDAYGLREFDAGNDVPSYGGFPNRRLHRQTVGVPTNGDWWLIIVNRRDESVRVWYEVT